jgi:O-antigen/teichoic acid export membrane protein
LSRDKVVLIDALGVVVFGYTLTEHFSALLAGKEEMGWEAILKVVSRSLGLSGAFIALWLHQSLPVIVTAMALGTLLSYAGSAIVIRQRFGVFGYEFDGPFLKSLMRSCIPVFGSIVFWVMYENQDILLLNHFALPNREIGLFSAAMKIIDVLRVFPVLLIGVYFPSLVRISLGPRQPFVRRTRALLGFMLVGGVLVTLAALPASTFLIRTFYGSGFGAAAPILRLLLLAYACICLNHTFQQLTIARDLEGKLFMGAIVACLSNLAGAWMMIQRFGVPGVCYALIGSEVLYLIFQAWTIYRIEPDLMRG